MAQDVAGERPGPDICEEARVAYAYEIAQEARRAILHGLVARLHEDIVNGLNVETIHRRLVEIVNADDRL